MTWTVHKQILNLQAPVNDLDIPEGSEILMAREQGDNICVWYRCDPHSTPLVRRRFLVVPTGGVAPFPELSTFVGLASLNDGMYIFHVFELLDL